MNNYQAVEVGTFRNILLDLLVANNKLDDERENPEKTVSKEALLAIRHTLSKKKKNKAQTMANRLVIKGSSSKASRESGLPTPSPVAIKLIWLGK